MQNFFPMQKNPLSVQMMHCASNIKKILTLGSNSHNLANLESFAISSNNKVIYGNEMGLMKQM